MNLVLFMFSLSVLLLVAIVSGHLIQKVKMPKITGEVFGGIILGPTILGTLFPEIYNWLFFYSHSIVAAREMFLKLCALLILFVIGLEVDLSEITRLRRTVLWTSFFGLAPPFFLGMASVLVFPGLWGCNPSGSTWLLPLFVGTALSISALPVIARILADLGMLRSKIGSVILATATIDDIVGWIFFALISAYFIPGSLADMNPFVTIGGVLTMFLVAMAFGNKLTKRFIDWCEPNEDFDNLFLGLTIVLVLIFSVFAQRIGIHETLGAFLVGLGLSNCERHKMYDPLRKAVMSLFSPLYFVSICLGVNLAQNFDLMLAVLVLAIATIGKVGGIWLGAKCSRLGTRESLAVGFGMNARGAVGIILITSGYEAGILDAKAYGALLLMAVATSILSGPIMKKVLA
ncbi:MAG: High-affinity Na(+)/H(+) antiporter NhaS3 [Syntrophorhabdaceae bacterium PtaU1.Bin034]|nr:MAG: High-affinity Na(+)/H(+) antiporter NhaS3 [Syntrophorhabdaceae bacterium PtaU1.Bin034]